MTQLIQKILQLKQHKKSIMVLAAMLTLTVTLSGCSQIAKIDEGVVLYEKVAAYLPEKAIHNPKEYEVQGADNEDIEFLTYIWQEEPYEVSKDEIDSIPVIVSTEIGADGKSHYYHHKRALHIMIDKKTQQIAGVVYDRDESDMIPPTKETEITRSKEARDAYVAEIVHDILGRDDLVFQEGYTETDQNGNAVYGYYYHGTIADERQYVMKLNYQYGYLMELYYFPNDALDDTTVEATFMMEGMEETVELTVNRQPGYYALNTDGSIFHRVPQKIDVDETFCDKYLRRVEPSVVQCYMKVGFVPNVTTGEWLDKVETDSDYAIFAPQTNPLGSYLVAEWVPTGECKVFPNEPNRQWREYMCIAGAYNCCYVTPYRDGVMVVQISHPYGSEDFEGMGARMAQMIDTLVLATE